MHPRQKVVVGESPRPSRVGAQLLLTQALPPLSAGAPVEKAVWAHRVETGHFRFMRLWWNYRETPDGVECGGGGSSRSRTTPR